MSDKDITQLEIKNNNEKGNSPHTPPQSYWIFNRVSSDMLAHLILRNELFDQKIKFHRFSFNISY